MTEVVVDGVDVSEAVVVGGELSTQTEASGSISAGSPGAGGGGFETAPFLLKTFTMLEDPSNRDLVDWGTEFTVVVKKPDEFSRVVLPKYFKHSNFNSFVRQLNIYGFKKVETNSNSWEFRHEEDKFRRGYKHLLCEIKRKVHPPKSRAGATSAGGDPSASSFQLPKLDSVDGANLSEGARMQHNLLMQELLLRALQQQQSAMGSESSSSSSTVDPMTLESGSSAPPGSSSFYLAPGSNGNNISPSSIVNSRKRGRGDEGEGSVLLAEKLEQLVDRLGSLEHQVRELKTDLRSNRQGYTGAGTHGIVRLSVGGTLFTTTTDTLRRSFPSSLLAEIADEADALQSEGDDISSPSPSGASTSTSTSQSEDTSAAPKRRRVQSNTSTTSSHRPHPRDSDGSFFIDRPSKHFAVVLDFLRGKQASWPTDPRDLEDLAEEFAYYRIPFPSTCGTRS